MTGIFSTFTDYSWIATVVFKTILVLGFAWPMVWLIRKRNPFWRLFVLRFVAVGVLALPLLALVAPTIPLPVLRNPVPESIPERQVENDATGNLVENHSVSIQQPTESRFQPPVIPAISSTGRSVVPSKETAFILDSRNIGMAGWIAGIWISGLGILSLLAWIKDWRIAREMKKATPAPDFARKELETICDEMGILMQIDLCCLPSAVTPFTVGILRPRIALPPRLVLEESRNDLKAVLAHELSHIRSHDLAWKACFRMVQSVLWFNPFAWLMRMSHDAVCEELSDAKAALYVGNAQSYSQILARVTLDLLTHPPAYAGLGMARLPEIRRRLEVLKRAVTLSPLSKSTTYSLILVGGFFLTGLAGFQVVRAESDTVLNRSIPDRNGPYTVGEKWIYQHWGNRTFGDILQPVRGDRVMEITGICLLDGETRWMMKEKWGDTDFDPSRSFIDEKRMLHRVESGADIISFSPPPYMDWLDLAPGERKTVQTVAASEKGDSLFTISVERLADETIVVPAGEFADCIKVGMTVNYAIPQKSHDSIDFHHTYWYHPTVNGFVKETFSFVSAENTGGDSAIGGIAVLKSHNVPQ